MADFPYLPDPFDNKCKSRYNTESTIYENKVEDSRLITSKKLRTWEELKFTVRTKSEMDAAIVFFDLKKENLTSFSISIDGETVTGKFIKDSFWNSRRSYAVYDYGFGFQEVP